MPFRIRVEGVDSVRRLLAKVPDGLPVGLMRAALEAGGDIGERVRVRTGRLRGSWAGAHPVLEQRGRSWRAVTGTDVEYAPYVGSPEMPTGSQGIGEEHALYVIDQNLGKYQRIIEDAIAKELR